MAMIILHPVFLLAACFPALAAHVEPPTNVSLRCRNLHNTVTWAYSHFQSGLQFRVDIGSLRSQPQEILVEPPNLQADISFLIDPSDSYFVTVTAVVGQNESDAAPPDGINFSYFMNSPAKQTCVLDFPPINVTSHQDGSVLFHFMHPWLLYQHKLVKKSNPEKSMKMKRHEAPKEQFLPELKYYVSINKTVKHLTCEENECSGKLAVDLTQGRPCLKVKGEMETIEVQATKEYCALSLEKAPHELNSKLLIYTILPVLFIGVVACVAFMVYKKKTKPTSSLPDSMTVPSQWRQWNFGVVQQQISVPEVEATSPTPLLTTTEEAVTVVTPSEPDSQIMDEGVCDVAEETNDLGSGYTHGRNMEEDDAQFFGGISSDYEKRQVLVELEPGDEAEGYRS